jgi:hypothetical protein
MTQTTVGKSARLLVAAALAFVAHGAQAQTSAITYPSVARSTPAVRAAEPAATQQRHTVAQSAAARCHRTDSERVRLRDARRHTVDPVPMTRHSATADLQASLPNR